MFSDRNPYPPKKRGLRTVKKTTLKKRLYTLVVLLLCLNSYLAFFGLPVRADVGWIRIQSPSGGTFYTADTLHISWTSSNAGSAVDIQLFVGGAPSMTIASNVANSGNNSYNWVIPSGAPISTQCRIKIVSVSNVTIFDYSVYFSLDSRYVSITSPGQGSEWYGDEAHTITWTSKNVGGSVQLSLYRGDVKVKAIAQSVLCSQGSYFWEIPTTIESGTTYRVRIEAIAYPGISSFGTYFSIKRRLIQVTSPTQGSVWYLGGIYQITWSSENAGSMVDVSLYEKKPYSMSFQFSSLIIAGTDNDGRLTWTVPSILASDSFYRIHIISTMYSNVFNDSETFQLEQRYIQVSSPKDSDIWYLGGNYTITWSSKNAGNLVNIELYQNGAQKVVLAENITNSGQFAWSIPLGATPDASSQIKIRSSNLSSVYGISGMFSLAKKSVVVMSPSEAEVLYKGDRSVVTWETKGFSSNVKLELYSESATMVIWTIAGDVPNSGRYEWTVPLDVASGSQYKIKITSIADESIFGYSPGNFVIESTFLQQWSETILLFIVVSIVFAVALFFIIRKWRRRISLEQEDQSVELLPNVPEQLTDEEYENIWEKNRD